MNTKALSYALLVAVPIVMFGCGYGCGRKAATPQIQTVTDTLTVHDTIVDVRPVVKVQRIIDSIRIMVIDTVHVRDTFFIRLPRTEKVYQDSNYRAVVSGYRPSLDTIEVYQTTQFIKDVQIVKVQVPKRWGLGVHAGYGVGCRDGQVVGIPYVGVGLSYNFVRF